jgi:poly(U)-specific endoribonuclease
VVKEATSQDYEDFKTILTSLWFDLCGRGVCSSSSSAFEHVFVGEIKGQRQGDTEVSGFHNWIQASSWLLVVLQHHNFVCFCIWMRLWWCWRLMCCFTWKNPMSMLITKVIYSQWGVGSWLVSSQYTCGTHMWYIIRELNLFNCSAAKLWNTTWYSVSNCTTHCFFAGEEDNHVDIGPYSVNIKCYRLGHNKTGSAFPNAENWLSGGHVLKVSKVSSQFLSAK